MTPAGYSGTPLAQKLGLRDGQRVFVAAAPTGYADWLAPLPTGLVFAREVDSSIDLVHHFADARAELAKALATYRRTLRADATVWVSWPKKAARRPTDLDENVVRELALPLGFVDVKVCAVSEVWSGLKLVVRKELR